MMNALRITLFVLITMTVGLFTSNEAEALLDTHDCTFCHSLHSSTSTSSFVPQNSPTNVEVLCLGCHLTANGATAAVQPHRTGGSYAEFYLTCTNCHNVHDNVPNWRVGHSDAADGNDGSPAPTGWVEGINAKMIGREDPDGATPYAMIQTREADFDKDGVPDRDDGGTTQSCNPAVLNDCYVQGKRHVIFENIDGSASGASIHGFADNNEDGVDDDTAIGVATDAGGVPVSYSEYDSVCQMCHSQTANHNTATGKGMTHNSSRRCTDCHEHGFCFDRGNSCSKWTVPNRDLQVDTVSAAPASVDPGQTVTITVDVTNLGDSPEVIDVRYVSDLEGVVGFSKTAEIPAGGSGQTSFDWVTVDSGTHTVTGKILPGIGELVIANNSGTDIVTVTQTDIAALTVVKTATPSTYNAINDVISYSFLVTNSGTITLAGPVTIADDQTINESCPAVSTVGNNDGNFDPAEAITCTASYTISQADLDSGSVTNIATASADGTTSPSDTETVTAVQSPALTLVKTATPLTYSAVSEVISYSFLVTNSGNVTLAGPVTIADDKATDENCPVGGLAPGANTTCTASYTITQADLDSGFVTNIATASANGTTSPSDSETATAIQTKTITMVKTATPTQYIAADDVIAYTFLVNNTGNVTLAGPGTIADDKATDEACPAGDLAPGANKTCTASYTITAADVTAESVTNIATATIDGVTSPSDTATVTLIPPPALTLAKTATPSTYNAVNDVISYSFLVSNTSSSTSLAGPVTISDDKTTNESCPAVSTVGNNDGNFDAGETITCTASYTITQADLDSGSVTNIATASAGAETSQADTAIVTAVQSPALTMVKTATPLTYNAVNDVISYSFLVTNSGNVTLAGPFTVADDKATDESCPAGSLAPGANKTCTASYTITQADLDSGSVTNIATASANGTTSPSDSETVTALQTRTITMAKTAAPSTYNAVDDVIAYTFLVTNTGNVTLAGPGTVADDKATDEACPAGNLSPGADKTCTASYTITQADLNAGSVTNIATATIDGITSPSDTATATAVQSPTLTLAKSTSTADYTTAGDTINYSYLVTNSGNISLAGPVNVADDVVDVAGSVTCPAVSTVGNADANLDPSEAITCTAAYTVTAADVTAGSVTNIATASADGTSSNSDTVTVNKVVTSSNDLAITSITFVPASPINTCGSRSSIDVIVRVTNEGSVAESNFFVALSADQGDVGNFPDQQVTSLAAGTFTDRTFNWNFGKNDTCGIINFTGSVTIVPGETDTADNSLTEPVDIQ